MDFRFLLLSALLCHASSSPIVTVRASQDALSPSSPGPGVPFVPGDVSQHHDRDPHSPVIPDIQPIIGADREPIPVTIRGQIRGRRGSPDGPSRGALPLSESPGQTPLEEGCTTTLPRIPWACSWDGTQTLYPSTTVRYTSLDCSGCSQVDSGNNIHFCPNKHIIATKTVTTASTFWSTVCEPSIIPAHPTEAEVARVTLTEASIGNPTPKAAPIDIITAAPTPTVGSDPRQADAVLAACPTTLVVQPEQSAGKTLTTYSRYTTTTIRLSCGGCPLVISTALVGYGPPGVFTKTTTLPVGTKTTYACL